MDPYRYRTNLHVKVDAKVHQDRGREQRRQECVAASKYYQSWELCSETQKKFNSIEMYEASIRASTPVVFIDRKANLESRRLKLRNLFEAEEALYAKELDESRKSTWKPSTGPLPTGTQSCFLDTFNTRPVPRIRDIPTLRQIENGNLNIESKTSQMQPDFFHAGDSSTGVKELKQLYINQNAGGPLDSKIEVAVPKPKPKENIASEHEQDENANPSINLRQENMIPKETTNVLKENLDNNIANKNYQPEQEKGHEVSKEIESQKISPTLAYRRSELRSLFQTEEQNNQRDIEKEIEPKKTTPTLTYRRSQLRSLFQSEEAEIAKEFTQLSQEPTTTRRVISRSNSKRTILNID